MLQQAMDVDEPLPVPRGTYNLDDLDLENMNFCSFELARLFNIHRNHIPNLEVCGWFVL